MLTSFIVFVEVEFKIEYNDITGNDPFENGDQFDYFSADCEIPKRYHGIAVLNTMAYTAQVN